MLRFLRVPAIGPAAVMMLAAALAGGQAPPPVPSGPPPLPAMIQWHPLPSGGQFAEITIGKGATPRDGQTAVMHFTGWLDDGKQVDSSRNHQKPFGFVVGSKQVIPGWDEGIRGMRVGGVRRLVLPPAAAYGSKGVPNVIPPNATLIFDIELLRVIDK